MGVGKWSTTSAILLSVAGVLCAAPASADQNDDAFIAALQRDGIAFSDRDAAITAGHNICAGLDRGETPAALIGGVVRNTDLSARQAAYLIGASVASYCPQHRNVVDNPGS
ncbi:MAG TPA: DUF732 domain-containing protein [Mycobacterium sp.]|nr:DUF732 domain-containing protein [Mycobacterium sp.]HTX94231.1 DUF732 domain-containing protein [Mycobacterium sp.]